MKTIIKATTIERGYMYYSEKEQDLFINTSHINYVSKYRDNCDLFIINFINKVSNYENDFFVKNPKEINNLIKVTENLYMNLDNISFIEKYSDKDKLDYKIRFVDSTTTYITKDMYEAIIFYRD